MFHHTVQFWKMELKQISAVFTLVSCSHLLIQIVYVRHVSTGDNDTDDFSDDGEK